METVRRTTPERGRETVQERLGDEGDCPYLEGERARMCYRWIEHCTPETYLDMLERGWRRFGRVFFRPVCAACRECRSLRIDVEQFKPSRSMRRAEKRNGDLDVAVGRPTVSDQHLELYHRYHDDMSARKGWREADIAPYDYYRTFVEGHEGFGYEFLYFLGGQLAAVALIDVLPRAVSAVYCYYDPDLRPRSLGVYSVLRQVDFARMLGVPYLYLGYRVEGNASMAYKARYRPHEILAGRPGAEETPLWQPGGKSAR